eukprot:CAMPEP_0197731172 /NCGR_PEP_ID=MMETSP1434-20131217/36631_1 /TAXON_ID=265543 /ORGANISM="Minutocellus polymorphus, Strain CCMP3303" /LENGTH=65 /DNA_ID=CAMNT_0043318125 /DNA_START=95 /DNA_END=292 /DNA_ORIENTATION=-
MNGTSELIIDVDLDDLIEGLVCLEAQGLGSLGIEAKLPIANDGIDEVILLHLDKVCDFLTCNPLE